MLHEKLEGRICLLQWPMLELKAHFPKCH